MSESKPIILTSSDSETFEVSEAVAREFEIVAHMLEDDCTVGNIPISNVNGKTLAKVIEYCKTHVEAGNVEGNEEAKKALEDFDKTWLDDVVDMPTLFELIMAANYLNIKDLLNITCQRAADNIKNKEPEEIRKIFGIKNDFTAEEEAVLRNENAWAFE